MATIGTYKDSKGKTLSRILFVAADGSRKTIYCGPMSKSDVGSVKGYVEKLVSAQIAGHVPDDRVMTWVAKLSKPLAKKLAGVGLIERPEDKDRQAATLDAFCERFIEGRAAKKPGTRTCYEQCRRKLVKYFGADRKIARVTQLDADEFREWRQRGVSRNDLPSPCQECQTDLWGGSTWSDDRDQPFRRSQNGCR